MRLRHWRRPARLAAEQVLQCPDARNISQSATNSNFFERYPAILHRAMHRI
jgi:hypothetical protein